jgi:twitching motility protein PilT
LASEKWEPVVHINELLTTIVDLGGSDLHLKVGNYPIGRIKGRLTPLTRFKKLVQEDTIAMAYSIMATDRQKSKFKENMDIDLAYSVPALGRFRCNIFNQRGTVGMVLRVIPRRIFSIEDLMLPRVLSKICEATSSTSAEPWAWCCASFRGASSPSRT